MDDNFTDADREQSDIDDADDDGMWTDEDRSELECELLRRELIAELRPHFTN